MCFDLSVWIPIFQYYVIGEKKRNKLDTETNIKLQLSPITTNVNMYLPKWARYFHGLTFHMHMVQICTYKINLC